MENTTIKALNIYQKLAYAKKEFASIKKDTKGYGYDYATLNQVIEAIQIPLLNNGLDFLQEVKDNKMTTQIIDLANGDIKNLVEFEILSVAIAKANELQQFGGGLTYLRRYSLLIAFGLACEDNDGADAKNIIVTKCNPQVHINPTDKKDMQKGLIELRKSDITSLLSKYSFSDEFKNMTNGKLNNQNILLKDLDTTLANMNTAIELKKVSLL